MAEIVVMTTSVGSRDEARRIAGALVEERLAACVQLSPIESCYRWEGQVARADELLLTIKTRASCAQAVTARIRALHSYTLPEILVLPVTGGLPDYLAWIKDVTEP